MNNRETDRDDITPEDEDEREERASVRGMGWDVLVGGRGNPYLTEGEEPFDQPAVSRSRGEPGPWSEDQEIADILEGANIPDRGHGAGGEEIPPEVFWDRGRGAERPEPSPPPGQPAEAAPRDLRPEDLGYRPSVYGKVETRKRGAPQPEAVESAVPAGPASEMPRDLAHEAPRDLAPDDPFFTGAGAPSGGSPLALPTEAGRPAHEPGMDAGPLALVEPAPSPVAEPPKEAVPMPDMPVSEPTEEAPREAPPRPIAAAADEEAGAPSAPGLSEGVTVTPVAGPSLELEEMEEPFSPGPPAVGEPPLPEPEPIPSPVFPDTLGGPLPIPPEQPPWAIPAEAGRTRGMGGAIADPFASVDLFAPPVIEGKEAEEELLPDERIGTMLITNKRIRELWEVINVTYESVISDVRGHYDTTEKAIDDLKKARELLLSGVENFDNAEELVMGVKARLRREEKVREWSRTTGTWLALYLVVWLLALVPLALLFLAALRFETYSAPWVIPDWLSSVLLPGLFGGVGGVVGALWVLIEHTARKRDFDPIHTSWYLTNPFMGFALGEVTYLVIWGGGFILTNVAGVGGELDLFGGSIFLYMVCVIVGFNQNVLWELIDRVVHALRPAERKEELGETETGRVEPNGPAG